MKKEKLWWALVVLGAFGLGVLSVPEWHEEFYQAFGLWIPRVWGMLVAVTLIGLWRLKPHKS